MIKRALISTFDKTGVAELAAFLSANQVEILATGGTARLLLENNIPITYVSDYTGFPEILGGRVKSLHPKIHGALLHRGAEDIDQLKQHEITPIDLVVVNLYPFEEVSRQAGAESATVIEQIDIGGPTMIRAAAKNYQHVTVVTDPNDYEALQAALARDGSIDVPMRISFAQKAFALVARYNQLISAYFGDHLVEGVESQAALPKMINQSWHLRTALRYGENPQQAAGVYSRDDQEHSDCLAVCQPLQGKALSYNNLLDSDCAVQCVRALPVPSCVIVKHASPCGVAVGTSLHQAYLRALAADSVSAFGGIVAFNAELNADTATEIVQQQFAEVVLAPTITVEALEVLSAKKNLRVVQTQSCVCADDQLMMHSIDGGMLVQQHDHLRVSKDDLTTATQASCSAEAIDDALFADTVCQYLKSNAIVLARSGQTIGMGTGQPSRIMSLRIAIEKAKDAGFELVGSVMASDAFFPFPDCVALAAEHGIKVIIQPGGSIRDKEVIAECDRHGVTMLLSGIRHFRH